MSTTIRSRPAVAIAVAFALLLLVVLIVGPSAGTDGPPYDPESTAGDGLLGLVRTLEAIDVEVEVDGNPPSDTATRAFAPVSMLTPEALEVWDDWVRDGGTLVVADPWSGFHDRGQVRPGVTEALVADTRDPACARIDPSITEVVQTEWNGLEVRDGDEDCFVVDGDHSWLILEEVGDGQRILLGSAQPFTNAWLSDGDNAALATALLAPEGTDQLRFLPRTGAGGGDIGLFDLVSDGVWNGLLLLAIAVLVAVLARARRLGRPVLEALPPVLPSAELATSLAGLSRRAGDRRGAAEALRARARQATARAIGVTPDTPPQELFDRAALVARVDPEVLALALLPRPVVDDDGLLQVAQAVAEILGELQAPTTATEHPEAAPTS